MEKEWVKVYSSVLPHQVEIVKAVLKDFGIESVIMDKQDSMYRAMNDSVPVELLVMSEDVMRSKHLINQNEL